MYASSSTFRTDKIISTAKKLKRLADAGINGEKDAAAYMLERFLKKHNLKMKDIADDKQERVFKVDSFSYAVILSNCALSICPTSKSKEYVNAYAVVLDNEDYLELQEKSNYFYQTFQKELTKFLPRLAPRPKDLIESLCLSAFIKKHEHHFTPDRYATDKCTVVERKPANVAYEDIVTANKPKIAENFTMGQKEEPEPETQIKVKKLPSLNLYNHNTLDTLDWIRSSMKELHYKRAKFTLQHGNRTATTTVRR